MKRNGSDESLAIVTYLPGVAAPAEPFPFRPLYTDSPDSTDSPDGSAPDDSIAAAGDESSDGERSDDPPESAGERSARASNVSMHALARRGMSSREMEELLRSRHLDDESVAREIARLEGVGLLDDRELASNLLRTMHERKGLGRSAIMAEMRRKHVDQSAIDEALSTLDGDDELLRATELAVKRAPQLRSLEAGTARRRLSAFLMRKGYGGNVVSAAVTEALGANRTGAAARDRTPRFD